MAVAVNPLEPIEAWWNVSTASPPLKELALSVLVYMKFVMPAFTLSNGRSLPHSSPFFLMTFNNEMRRKIKETIRGTQIGPKWPLGKTPTIMGNDNPLPTFASPLVIWHNITISIGDRKCLRRAAAKAM